MGTRVLMGCLVCLAAVANGGAPPPAEACLNPVYVSVSAETRAIQRANDDLRAGRAANAYRSAYRVGAQLARRSAQVAESMTRAMPSSQTTLLRQVSFLVALATVRLEGRVNRGRVVRQLGETARRAQLVSAHDELRGMVERRELVPEQAGEPSFFDERPTGLDPRIETAYLEATLALNPHATEALARFRALHERDLLPGPDTLAALARSEAAAGHGERAGSVHAQCLARTTARQQRAVCGPVPEPPAPAAAAEADAPSQR